MSNHLTFADIFMFTQLYDNITEMTDDQKLQYNNLFRWYKHVQNLPEIKNFLEAENRLIVADPAVKLSFLEVKKKKKWKNEQCMINTQRLIKFISFFALFLLYPILLWYNFQIETKCRKKNHHNRKKPSSTKT